MEEDTTDHILYMNTDTIGGIPLTCDLKCERTSSDDIIGQKADKVH